MLLVLYHHQFNCKQVTGFHIQMFATLTFIHSSSQYQRKKFALNKTTPSSFLFMSFMRWFDMANVDSNWYDCRRRMKCYMRYYYDGEEEANKTWSLFSWNEIFMSMTSCKKKKRIKFADAVCWTIIFIIITLTLP